MSEMMQIADDHPVKRAWDKYRETNEFANSKRWALRIAPMVQSGPMEDRRRKRQCDIMPLEQREMHVEGALWAMFFAGWIAALEHDRPPPVGEAKPLPEPPEDRK